MALHRTDSSRSQHPRSFFLLLGLIHHYVITGESRIACGGRRWGDSNAAPEVEFPGRREAHISSGVERLIRTDYGATIRGPETDEQKGRRAMTPDGRLPLAERMRGSITKTQDIPA